MSPSLPGPSNKEASGRDGKSDESLAEELTAVAIGHRVRAGDITPERVAEIFIERTRKWSKSLNTHIFFDENIIGEQLEGLNKRLSEKKAELPLAGVPILIKDNIVTEGMPTTCGSKLLEGYKAPYDAHVISRLKDAGAILFGKANCDEFAMGSSNENSAFGAVRNPYDLDRVPGGSSGGSAAAVAACMVPVALGTDTGGSIRQPAGFCGVVGLKPTYGRVSRYGLVAYGSSLDQIGPLCQNVEDTALLLDVLSGHDRRDSTSRALPPTRTLDVLGKDASLSGVKIGVIDDLMQAGLSDDVRSAVEAASEVFRERGAQIVKVSLPSLKYSVAAYYVIAPAEASANLARYDGIRYGNRKTGASGTLQELYRKTRSEGFGREVKQRIMIGTFALSSGYYDAYYGRAMHVRRVLAREFDAVFNSVDLLLSPTSPSTAFRHGEKLSDPLAMYLSDIGTIAANLVGLPALSLPCGTDKNGLPIGLHLMTPALEEEKLLRGAYVYEQAAGWSLHPEL